MRIKIDESTKLDEITLSNIIILEIDEQKIRNMASNTNEKIKQQVVFYRADTKRNNYRTINGEQFQFLKVKDVACITQLVAGMDSMYGAYCKVQLNVRKAGIGNLIGNTIDAYWEDIGYAQEILWHYYGVNIDFSTAKIQTIEINRTFMTSKPFHEYERVLRLLIHNMPRMNLNSSFANCHKLESISTWSNKNRKSKNFTKVIFYDKKRQIAFQVRIDDEIIRFEIKLVGNRTIQRKLKCDFIDLTQEKIELWFSEQIKKLIITPLKKWKKEQYKELAAIVNEEYTKGGLWQIGILGKLQELECINKSPLLLDVEELFPILDKIKTISHKSQVKKRMRKRAEIYHTIFTHDDHRKLDEIIEKLTNTSLN